jgi:phenylpropionate dioxygenase-like ring-hydroxylating dioxygenase large terminal subunit
MNALKNAWYVAAWPDEIFPDGLLGRVILNEPILMFRKRDGSAVAIGDRCPHRFAPLHLGRHRGDSVQCGYHGLEFGADGRCSRNPHGNGAKPASATVPVYPLIERHGMIWIWMGKKEPDPALIPSEFAFVADPGRAHVKGRLQVAANYLLLVDNLMDLSHGLYLHPSLATQEMQQNFRPKTRVEGDVVICEREQPNIEPPPIWVPSLPPDAQRVDFSATCHGTLPQMLSIPSGVDGSANLKVSTAVFPLDPPICLRPRPNPRAITSTPIPVTMALNLPKQMLEYGKYWKGSSETKIGR